MGREGGGGAPTRMCAVPHCSVCAPLQRSVLHSTMRAVLHRTVLRTTLHRMRCARHYSVHCAAPCASCHTALCVQFRTALCCPPPLCLVHVSTGWRVWWAWCLCSQPLPRHLSRDNGGAALAAPRPLHTYRSRCSPRFAAAMTLSQPLRGRPPPHYQSRGYRGAATATPRLQPTYSRYRSRCFAAALAPHLFCSTPSPRYLRGPMGLLQL